MWQKHNILMVQKDVALFWQNEPKHYNISELLLLFHISQVSSMKFSSVNNQSLEYKH